MRKAILLLIAVITLAWAFPSAGHAACVDCSQDPLPVLEGQWRGHVVTTDPAGTKAVSTLSVTLDDHGVLVSGSLAGVSSGKTVRLASGCMIIDSSDQLGGSFTDENGVLWCLPTGRVSQNGELLSFVFQTWEDVLGHAVLIKHAGTFALSDLDGGYKGQAFRIGAGATGPGNVNLSVTNSVLGQSNYDWLKGSYSPYLSGTLALTGSGDLAGSLTTAGGTVQTVVDGLMAGGKSMVSAAFRQSDGDDSTMLMLRLDANVTTADLAGAWLLLAVETNSAGALSILDGGLDLTASGALNYGSYSYLRGQDGSFTGGGLSALSNGMVSGRYRRDDNAWFTISDGIMDKSKDIVSFTYSGDNGQLGKAILIRQELPAVAPSTTTPTTLAASSSSSGGGGGGGCAYDADQSLSLELLATLAACSALFAIRRSRR